MEKITFDTLPKAVTLLTKEVSELKRIILEKQEKGPEDPIEQLLTVQQAAQFLKLTVPTVYSKVSRNELPVNKRGNRLYFSSSELMDYVKQGRKKTNVEIEAEAEAYLSNKRGS